MLYTLGLVMVDLWILRSLTDCVPWFGKSFDTLCTKIPRKTDEANVSIAISGHEEDDLRVYAIVAIKIDFTFSIGEE